MEEYTFLELLHREQVTLIMLSAGFGAILIDWLMSLPAEIKYIYHPDLIILCSGQLPSLPSILLLIPRVATLPIVSLAYSIFVGSADTCTLKWRFLLGLYSFVTINSFCVFSVRLIAIRNSRRPMIFFLISVILAHAGVMAFWLLEAEVTPARFVTPTQAICTGLRLADWTYKLFIAFGTLDVMILMLTLYDRNWANTKVRLQTTWQVWKSDTSNVTQQFYSHTIFYFALQIIFMYGEAIWVYHYAQDRVWGIITAPLHLLLTLSVSSKVIRSLKLYSAKNDKHGSASTHASSNHSSQRFYEISGNDYLARSTFRTSDDEEAGDPKSISALEESQQAREDDMESKGQHIDNRTKYSTVATLPMISFHPGSAKVDNLFLAAHK